MVPLPYAPSASVRYTVRCAAPNSSRACPAISAASRRARSFLEIEAREEMGASETEGRPFGLSPPPLVTAILSPPGLRDHPRHVERQHHGSASRQLHRFGRDSTPPQPPARFAHRL